MNDSCRYRHQSIDDVKIQIFKSSSSRGGKKQVCMDFRPCLGNYRGELGSHIHLHLTLSMS